MQGWTQLDAASVIAMGTLVALFGLSGVLGYLPFRTLNSRNLAKLRERVPLFRTWTDEKYFAVQVGPSLCWACTSSSSELSFSFD